MIVGACICCGIGGDKPVVGDPPEHQHASDLVELPGSLPARRLWICRGCVRAGNARFASNRLRGLPPPKRLG